MGRQGGIRWGRNGGIRGESGGWAGGIGIIGLGVWGAAVLRPYKVGAGWIWGRLLVAAVGGFFAVFVDVFDYALEDEQVGSALAGELDAIAVVPFDRAAQGFAVIENDRHLRAGLHLLDPIKILSVRQLRRSRLLAGRGPTAVAVGRPRRHLFFHVRETRTEHPAVHHDCSLE